MRYVICFMLMVMFGCQSSPDLTELKLSIRSASEEIVSMNREQIDKTNVVIDVLRENTDALAAIKSRIDDIDGQVREMKPVAVQVETSPEQDSVPDATAQAATENPVAEPEPHYSDEVSVENWSASYCGVCRTEKDILESLKNRTGLQYWTYMADDPKRLEFVKRKQIERAPTLRFIRRGKEMKRLVGLRQASEIQSVIDEVRAMNLTDDESNVGSSDDLTIRLKLPVVETRWGLIDLEEFNCECPNQRCVELRAIKADYLDKPEFQNIGRRVEPGEQ